MKWVNDILGTASNYPDIVALLCGTFLSWAPGLILETWFLPEAWPARKTKQVTLSVTVVVSFVTTTMLWHYLDPIDTKAFVGITSFIAAMSAPLVHVAAAAVLTHYFPYLDSVFKFKPKTGN